MLFPEYKWKLNCKIQSYFVKMKLCVMQMSRLIIADLKELLQNCMCKSINRKSLHFYRLLIILYYIYTTTLYYYLTSLYYCFTNNCVDIIFKKIYSTLPIQQCVELNMSLPISLLASLIYEYKLKVNFPGKCKNLGYIKNKNAHYCLRQQNTTKESSERN